MKLEKGDILQKNFFFVLDCVLDSVLFRLCFRQCKLNIIFISIDLIIFIKKFFINSLSGEFQRDNCMCALGNI